MKIYSNSNNDSQFDSSDLPLVAALCSYGARITSVDRNCGPRTVFFLEMEKGLFQLIQAYYARELRVEPLTYFLALRDAKSRLYGPSIE